MFDISVDFPELPAVPTEDASRGEGVLRELAEMQDRLPGKIEEQLGLKLEPSKTPVEILVIERAQKPDEN